MIEYLVTSQRVLSIGGWRHPHVIDEIQFEDINALELRRSPMVFRTLPVAVFLALAAESRRFIVPDPCGFGSAIWDAALTKRSGVQLDEASEILTDARWVLPR